VYAGPKKQNPVLSNVLHGNPDRIESIEPVVMKAFIKVFVKIIRRLLQTFADK
jgi:hypothetical protein